MRENRLFGVIALVVLTIISVVIGNNISGSLMDSAPAFFTIGAVVLVTFLVIFGTRAWVLLFVLPPFLAALPFPELQRYPTSFLLGFFFIAYWLVLRSLRISHFTWRSLPVLDVMIGIVGVYMLASFIMHPVSILYLGFDSEYIGGVVYAYAVGGLCYYFIMSALPFRRVGLEKVMKWAVYGMMVAQLIAVLIDWQRGAVYWAQSESEEMSGDLEIGERRVILFRHIGMTLACFLYAGRPLLSLLLSPGHLLGLMLGVGGVMLSGSRGGTIKIILSFMAISWARRELLATAMLGACAWGGLVLLGQGELLQNLPLTIQRGVAFIPGVSVSKEVRNDVEGSSEVRLIAWKQALNPSNGYIRDYVWGDGFQLSVAVFHRDQVATLRGTGKKIDIHTDKLAESGNWHNGFITTMHRLGLVGCLLFYFVFIMGIFLWIRVAYALSHSPAFPFYCVLTVHVAAMPIGYSYNAGTTVEFFGYLVPLSLVKVLYCMLLKEGVLAPAFQRHTYVPVMLRELANRQSADQL